MIIKINSYKNLIDAPHELLHMKKGKTGITQNFDIFIPLHFYFSRYNNAPLPLLALQYEDVILNIKLRDAKYLINRGFLHTSSASNNILPTINDSESSLISNQVWLSNEERKQYVNCELNYLIEQTQILNHSLTSSNNTNVEKRINLYFNNPVKSIFWVINQDKHSNLNQNISYPIIKHLNNKSADNNIVQNSVLENFSLKLFGTIFF